MSAVTTPWPTSSSWRGQWERSTLRDIQHWPGWPSTTHKLIAMTSQQTWTSVRIGSLTCQVIIFFIYLFNFVIYVIKKINNNFNSQKKTCQGDISPKIFNWIDVILKNLKVNKLKFMVFSFFSERPAQQWGQRHGYNNQTNDVWLSSRVIVIDSTPRGPRFRQVCHFDFF